MPGYEHERMKMREYLGIEWVEHGFDDSAQNDAKTIRHSSELDCTFDKPTECRWRNVERSENLDTLNFHLFEKIDFTEFPVLQVRPGPSKLDRGEKLLFTGDRKRDEQTAILRSSPIRCQNSTGSLTFRFWLYNGARVEVILLEKIGNKLRVLPEKPFVDCGTILLNTECTAEIPPRDTEFSIGIRAYDISNPEGSFVMIDNIVYQASLCRVSIDLGEDFHGRPFVTAMHEAPIGSAEQLKCDDFSSKCRWRAVGHSNAVWQVADNAPPENLMLKAVGTLPVPEAPFLFMYVEQNQAGPYNILQSDPIGCQSDRTSKFTFRFWTTRDVILEVCASDQQLDDLECHVAQMSLSPALVSISFKKLPAFTLTIKVKQLNNDYDNFIAIDDISYQGTFCSAAAHAWDLGSTFYATSMLSALLQRPILSAERAIDCMWANYEHDNEPLWQIGSVPLNEHKFYSLTKTRHMPDGEFAIVFLNAGESSTLITEPIRCIRHQATLTFRFWLSGSTRLDVCLIEDNVPEAIDCQKISLKQPGPVLVDLPEINHSIRIALKAEAASQRGFAVIDDITMMGDVCSTTTRLHGIRLHGGRSARPPDPNVCRLLTCSFKGEQTCLYSSGKVASSYSSFKARNGAVTAVLFRKGKVAMLESPTFRLNVAARIHFTYWIEKDASAMFVCHDSSTRELDNCFQIGNLSLSGWNHDFMEILPSDTKFYMIARLVNDRRPSRVSIANITLTDVENNAICT